MEVEKFDIEGLLLIQPKILGDERGFFCERYRVDRFAQFGVQTEFVQDNYSRSAFGILRGLHYQWDRPQTKLVTCTQGTILDVAVDIRPHSPTFGQHVSVVLSGEKPEWLLVPAGFAHGFLVLSEAGADVSYKVDAYWNGQGEGAIRWDDTDLAISWPLKTPSLSPKDQSAQSFADYKLSPKF